jgi:hypothetical protein
MKFEAFKSIPRLSKECIITEKIDGTNAQIVIMSFAQINDAFCGKETSYVEDFLEKYCLYVHPENPHIPDKQKFYVFAGSRNRWLDTSSNGDNFGFAKWVQENALDLVLELGEGRHYGEWMGLGVQRGYGLQEKRFYLFNVNRWHKDEPRLVSVDPKTKVEKYTKKCPDCCHVVPVLDTGIFSDNLVTRNMDYLQSNGSVAVPGFMNPEGIVVYHKASSQLFKKTFDDRHKGEI